MPNATRDTTARSIRPNRKGSENLKSVEEIYFAGYAAFDQGRFSDAIKLATQCLHQAAPDTYWYAGALGLRCWAANFMSDDKSVERDANALLALQDGPNSDWFEGLARFNLGLTARRRGRGTEAKEWFAQAAESYAVYKIQTELPAQWALIVGLFAAASQWVAFGNQDGLEALENKLANIGEPDEMGHIAQAVDLLLRYAAGDEVRSQAAAIAAQGTSRAFLALILLTRQEQRDEG
jgi:hypothetical protein